MFLKKIYENTASILYSELAPKPIFKSVSEELYNGISDSYFVNLHRSQSLKSTQLLQLHQEYYIVIINVVAAVVIIGSRGKDMQRTYFIGI